MKQRVLNKIMAVLIFMLVIPACSGSLFKKPVVLDSLKLDPDPNQPSNVFLTDSSTDELYGRLSPDGLHLVYASNQKGNLDIWLKDLTNGFKTRLTTHMAKDQMPSFSPDGKYIVFISMRDDVKGDIYLIKPNGKSLTKLTDRTNAESYPVFSADSKSIYFVSGTEESSKICNYNLETKKIKSIVDSTSTQPAVSPNGKLIAYIKKENGLNGLWIRNLSANKSIPITTNFKYHCGFPAFSPDNKTLYFSSFYYTHQNSALTGNEHSVVFGFDLAKLESKKKRVFTQLSSGKRTYLFLQAHDSGLVYTTKSDGNLDISMMSPKGAVPDLQNAEAQLAYALSLENQYDRLLALEFLNYYSNSKEYQQALYMSSAIYKELSFFDKQKKLLLELLDMEPAYGYWQGKAKVDLAVWDVEYTLSTENTTGIKVSKSQLERASKKLKKLEKNTTNDKHVLAYAYLKEGDILYLSDNDFKAIRCYETVINDFPEQQELVIRAKIKEGEIYSQLRTLDLQVSHYASLFKDYPKQEYFLRIAANHIIDEYLKFIESQLALSDFTKNTDSSIFEKQVNALLIDHLRNLIDRNSAYHLLGAIIQYQMGILYKQIGQLELAIQAMKNVVLSYPDQKQEVTDATFALGSYTLELSKQLRQQNRFNEAGNLYSQAIGYYEDIMNRFPPANKYYKLAKQNFISLGLLKAAQEENEKDIKAAKASYQRIVNIAPEVLQAHRKIIELSVKDKSIKQTTKLYEKHAKQQPNSYIWAYCLGYIILWKPNLTADDFDDAEILFEKSRNLNSQNPFVYFSLGWISEMKELYLGQYGEGLLEDAISLYTTAYDLNDKGLNIQLEADCLLNLGNAFSHIGNTWNFAYEYFHKRLALNLPFIEKTRKTVFLLNLGRAAFNLDKNDEASEHFENALSLAIELNLKELQAELIARLALNYQSQKSYGISTQYFERSIRIYNSVRNKTATIPLQRSIALNYYYQDSKEDAISTLDNSFNDLMKYVKIKEDSYSRITTAPGMSLSPFGFDKTRENEVHLSLYNTILSDLEQLKSSAPYLEQQLESMDLWLNQNQDDADITRAVSTLENRFAISSFELADKKRSLDYFNKAYLNYENIQSTELDPEAEFIKSTPLNKRKNHLSELNPELMISIVPEDFSAQLINLNASADILLSDYSVQNRSEIETLKTLLKRYENCIVRYDTIQKNETEPIVDPLITIKAKNNFALLAILYFQHNANYNKRFNSVSNAFNDFEEQTSYLKYAVSNLKSAISQTEIPEEESSETSAYNLEYLRYHIASLINLAKVFQLFEDSKQAQEKQKSAEFLKKAQSVCSRFSIDDICMRVNFEEALANNNFEVVDNIFDTYLKTSPQLLGKNYLQISKAFRNDLFTPAILHYLKEKNIKKAWQLLEWKKQKTIVDELALLKLAAESDATNNLIDKIYTHANNLDYLLKSQTDSFDEDFNKAIRIKINTQKQQVSRDIEELKSVSSGAQSAFTVSPFNMDELDRILSDDQAIIGLYSHNNLLYVLYKDLQTVKGRSFKLDSTKLSAFIDPAQYLASDGVPQSSKVTFKKLRKYLANISSGKSVVYLDTNCISPDMRLELFLSNTTFESTTFVRYSSLSALVTFYENKNLYRQNGIVTIDEQTIQNTTYTNALKQLSGNSDFYISEYPNTGLRQVVPYFSSSSFIMLNQPLDFEGISAANLWLKFNTDTKGFGHFAFYKHIDTKLKANFIIVSKPGFTFDKSNEFLLLEYYMGLYGLPGFALVNPQSNILSEDPTKLTSFIGDSRNSNRAAAYKNFLEDTKLKGMDAVTLYGFAGMTKVQTEDFVKSNLMPTIQKAIAYQKQNSHQSAIEIYEYALTMMDYLKEYKFLDKVLEMLVSESRKIKDYEKAITYQHKVLERAESAYKANPKLIVPVLDAKDRLSTYYTEIKLYDIALDYNQQILDTLLKYKRKNLTAPYYSSRGIITERAGLYEDSFKYYNTAYEIYRDLKDTKKQIKESINCARILRQRLSNYRLAKQYINEALNLASGSDIYENLLLRLGLLRVESALGNYQKSIDLARNNIKDSETQSKAALDKAMLIFKDEKIAKDKKNELLLPLKSAKLKFDSLVLSSYVELVNSLFRQGDYSEAIDMQKKAMLIAQKNKDIRKQIQLNNAKGLIYSFLGNTNMAIETFNWTLNKAKAIDDQTEQASAYNNLGDAYRKAGEFSKAKKMFLLALEIDRKQKDTLGISYDYANLGLVFENMGNYDSANSYLNNALKISRQIKNPINEVKSLLALGKIAMKYQQHDKADKYFTDGLNICKKLNLTDWQWKFNLQLGKLYTSLNKNEQALEYLMQGINTIEPLPSKIRIKRTGPRLEEDKSELYDSALGNLVSLGQNQKAFELSERARARHFLDILGGKSFDFKQNNTAALLFRESELRKSLGSTYDRYLKSKGEQKTEAEKEYQNFQNEYDQVVKELSEINNRLPSFVTIDTENIEALRSLIKPDTAIVSYYMATDILIIFTLTSDILDLRVIPISKRELIDTIKNYRKMLTGFNPVKNAGLKLYQLLLKPSENVWKQKADLVVVPHNALHFLPFSSLYDGEKYMVETRSIEILNSVNDLRYASSGQTAKRNDLAMGGPEVTTGNPSSPIPFTMQELLSYGYTNKDATVLINEKATEGTFKKLAPLSKYIHLATHGTFDSVNPFDSSIYLSKDKNTKEDGILKLHEIVTLNLNSDLVTLSACNTALGTIGEGDEIIGLSSAFLTAGSKQVIASLWRISDLSTAILMKHFFRNKTTMPTGKALRQAQLQVMKLFPHPAYWSGFILEGHINQNSSNTPN